MKILRALDTSGFCLLACIKTQLSKNASALTKRLDDHSHYLNLWNNIWEFEVSVIFQIAVAVAASSNHFSTNEQNLNPISTTESD